MNKKFILDASCGGRMFWYNKHHPHAIYIDHRVAMPGHCDHRKGHSVQPDVVMDFRSLSYMDKSFKLVVWDPPHFKGLGENSWMAKKYGTLNKDTWRVDLKKGFDECWRVLEDYGVLIVKWSTEGGDVHRSRSIPVSEVLKVFGREPLFGHLTGSKSNTKWMTFMKIPEEP